MHYHGIYWADRKNGCLTIINDIILVDWFSFWCDRVVEDATFKWNGKLHTNNKKRYNWLCRISSEILFSLFTSPIFDCLFERIFLQFVNLHTWFYFSSSVFFLECFSVPSIEWNRENFSLASVDSIDSALWVNYF